MDGYDDPTPEPEADDYDPPHCDRCDTPNDEWDRYCVCCGYPVGMYGRLKAEGQLEAYLAQVVDPETAPF